MREPAAFPIAAENARQSLGRILAWAIIVVAVVLAAGVGMVMFSASAIDEVQAQEEQALVRRTLERRLVRLTEDVTSATIWNEAVDATGAKPDFAWIDTNFGVYYAQYEHHDRTILFDAADRLIYASHDGKQTKPQASADFARDVAAVVSRVRRDQAAKLRRGSPLKGGFDSVSTATAAVRSGGDLYLVAAASVVAEDGAPGPTSATPVVVSAQVIGPAFLARLQEDLGISGMRLVKGSSAPAGTGEAQAVIAGLDGAGPLATLVWPPQHPGTGVIQRAALPILGVLVVFLLAAAGLGLRVSGVLRALTAHEATLSEALDDLTQARDRAEAASVAKSQFLANMSHEIRTPMNGVLGMAQVMAMGDLSPGQRERLAVLRESGEALLALLNDVLDLAKIEAGRLEIVREAVDLSTIVSGACATFAGMASEKGLTIRAEVAPEAEGLWRTDGGRVRQVLTNLISNAVKFTGAGEVNVSLTLADGQLRFAVADTGAGIPADRMGELFGKFNQIDASTTRRFGGTGLGLAICRDLVELLGGHIEAASEAGKGSRFSFGIPAERVDLRAVA
jgi:signal transduction histidine kinase